MSMQGHSPGATRCGRRWRRRIERVGEPFRRVMGAHIAFLWTSLCSMLRPCPTGPCADGLIGRHRGAALLVFEHQGPAQRRPGTALATDHLVAVHLSWHDYSAWSYGGLMIQMAPRFSGRTPRDVAIVDDVGCKNSSQHVGRPTVRGENTCRWWSLNATMPSLSRSRASPPS